MSGDELIGVSEAARIAGLSQATIRTYVRRGSIVPPLPVAGSDALIWRRADLEQWAATERRPGPKGPRTMYYIDVPTLGDGSRAADIGYGYHAAVTTNAGGTEFQVDAEQAWALHDELRERGYAASAPADAKGRGLRRP